MPLFLGDLHSLETSTHSGAAWTPPSTPILGVQRGDRCFTFNEIGDLALQVGTW